MRVSVNEVGPFGMKRWRRRTLSERRVNHQTIATTEVSSLSCSPRPLLQLIRLTSIPPSISLLLAIRHLGLYYSAVLSSSALSNKRSKKSSSSTSSSLSPPAATTIVLLTDDADNRRKATAEGLAAYSVREFVEMQKTEVSSSLMDLLAAVTSAADKKRGIKLFEEVCCPFLLNLILLPTGRERPY